MTYKELFEALQNLSDEQLRQTVTVHDCLREEFYEAKFRISTDTDVLDANHPVILF